MPVAAHYVTSLIIFFVVWVCFHLVSFCRNPVRGNCLDPREKVQHAIDHFVAAFTWRESL